MPATPTPAAPRGVLALGVAHALALLAAAAAATLYARWLSPGDFACWAMALALARAGLLLLDGGLKTALVRRAVLPSAASLRRLRWASAVLAVVGSALLGAVALWLAAPQNRLLLALYPAAYLLSYPLMFTALARLERAQQFAPVGRAEGLSVAVEFGLPVACMAAGLPHAAALLLGVWLARIARSAWIVWAARKLADAHSGLANGAASCASTRASTRAAALPVGNAPLRPLLREGAGIQAVAGLSMLRDTAHLWLVAPWFGAAWAGGYALAFTACALVGQVGVQTAARVALPALAAWPATQRWPVVLAQLRWLAIGTLPPLLLLPAWLAWADAQLWQGRWQHALLLLPWVVARWLGGVATGSLGAWLLAARMPWAAARAHALWTAAELALAAAALACFGPSGLALAAAGSVWVGVLLFLQAAEPGAPWQPRLRALLAALLLRPSLAAAGLLAWLVAAAPGALAGATLALPLCWLAEPAVQRRLATWAATRRARWRLAQRGGGAC